MQEKAIFKRYHLSSASFHLFLLLQIFSGINFGAHVAFAFKFGINFGAFSAICAKIFLLYFLLFRGGIHPP